MGEGEKGREGEKRGRGERGRRRGRGEEEKEKRGVKGK